MALISDSMQRTMLRAVGAYCLRVNGRQLTALFVSEFEAIELNGVVLESHDPLLICLSSDARLIEISKDQIVEGLPEQFCVKHDDGGDKTQVTRGEWAGFHAITLKRL